MKSRRFSICLILIALCTLFSACSATAEAISAPEPEAATKQDETAESAEIVKPAVVFTADEAILGVKALGFIDSDGAKLRAIAVEYVDEIEAASVSLDDYEIDDYSLQNPNLQDGAAIGSVPGIAVRVYVNDEPSVPAESLDGGCFVIIEVNTDYMLASVPRYTMSLIAGVKQVGEVSGSSLTVTPGTDFVTNYDAVSLDGGSGEASSNTASGEASGSGPTIITYKSDAYAIEGIEGYELHYKSGDENYDPDYPAFLATDCFEEATGELTDVELPYALYVPADYDPAQKYALVLHIMDAGSLGSDPMITLTEGQAPVNYASDEVQQLARDQGLGGIIVLSPQIETAIRTTRDNWTLSAGVPATWQLMDALTEQYSIDMDHIYGTGQSMGGMQIVAMAGQRDNYFAGLWLLGMQWGNNYNKEAEYNGAAYYPSTDATIWTVDDDGNDSDYGSNWYYLISDDNVLFTNCAGDAFSTGVWNEMDHLYQDISGVAIPRSEFHPLDLTVDEQNMLLREFLATDSGPINFHWLSFSGGSHMLTWVYGQRLDAGYEWLLSQSRAEEQSRPKLSELDRPWIPETDADKLTASRTEDRLVGSMDGEDVYLALPAEESGTIGYNTAQYGQGGGSILRVPGWTAD